MTAIRPQFQPDLARYREDYPILADTTYMNSNSMGAMPRQAVAALAQYAADWAREGVEVWPHWFDVLQATADSAARFLGAPAGQTILNQNVAYFQAAVASALDFSGPRNKVVVEALQFPNVLYVWDRYRELGADLHLVPSDDGMTIPLERMLAAIDERTAIVPISHGIYVSGALQDVKAICARAHEVGALVMVDVYQTVGVMPIDVHEWDADLVVGGSHKWLCGGPGTAFMWMKPALRERMRPRLTGWMGHADPFNFEAPPIRYASDHRHFLAGTPSMPAYYVARAAYENLHAIGLDRIRAHNLALAHIIIERAQARGLTVHSPLADDQRTGFVAVDFPSSEAASKQLIAERFKLDWRPNCGLRLGPHFYNTEAEVQRLMDRVAVLAGRA
ncbi:aminotransferase class V-fold PLP-dependent enzyme [Nannocystis sp.]|uniref:aminotransferase class V-fold PLP-dependent enzyme n=1 Tax=Nannocystis sp. TaxID=1962667 RepID=UPI0025EC1EAB|nr:aminotransferase class V-fold PLP-dependent enzyme [Nannocystis sp.]MBK7827803.1 aminotransferase class V-fold PLP-dependent enzyme [Nannocystis sp.]